MNYYIQGNKEKANQIKAAFEKLGYNSRGLDFSCGFFYTVERDVHYCVRHVCVVNIIKTHPDYKELELPAKAKFKEEDWIACDADSFTLSIKSVKDGNYYFHQGASLPIKDIDEHYHLWSIQDAKDGDVLCTYEGGNPKIVFILRGDPEGNCAVLSYYFYYNIMYPHFEPNAERGCLAPKREDVKPATEEQRDLLFAKMKEAGYEWDAEKKELRKIKPHYDIANFKPFDKVLVRDSCCEKWAASLFSNFEYGAFPHKFVCIDTCYTQCIPFEGNEHLLGTTDMPDEMYINW